MLVEQIADVLRTARKTLGLSQKEAARRAQVSQRLWAEVERGKRPNVSLETALRMLGDVGVTVRLTDPRGASTEVRSADTAAASRAARASVRRATWGGRQLTLDEEGADEPAAARGADRLAAVTLVSQQAFAVVHGRVSGARRPAARSSGRRLVDAPR